MEFVTYQIIPTYLQCTFALPPSESPETFYIHGNVTLFFLSVSTTPDGFGKNKSAPCKSTARRRKSWRIDVVIVARDERCRLCKFMNKSLINGEHVCSFPPLTEDAVAFSMHQLESRQHSHTRSQTARSSLYSSSPAIKKNVPIKSWDIALHLWAGISSTGISGKLMEILSHRGPQGTERKYFTHKLGFLMSKWKW